NEFTGEGDESRKRKRRKESRRQWRAGGEQRGKWRERRAREKGPGHGIMSGRSAWRNEGIQPIGDEPLRTGRGTCGAGSNAGGVPSILPSGVQARTGGKLLCDC